MSVGAAPLGGAEHKEANLAELGQALAAGQSRSSTGAGGTTSDLSLDGILLLHSVGLEPVQVVFGIGCISILSGVWNWATGPVIDAHDAFHGPSTRPKNPSGLRLTRPAPSASSGSKWKLRLLIIVTRWW